MLGGLFLFVLIFGRAIARFYVDYLWHRSLGRSDVFWGVLGAKVTLFAAFFLIFLVVAGVNLFIADRTAPSIGYGWDNGTWAIDAYAQYFDFDDVTSVRGEEGVIVADYESSITLFGFTLGRKW